MMKRADFLKTLLLGLGAAVALPSIGFSQESPTILRASPVHPSGAQLRVDPISVNSGNGFGNRIAITFDDGPTPGVTEPVLEALAKYRLRATFFMIGRNVKAYPSLAREVVAAGHEVANHTFTHPVLTKLSTQRVEDEIRSCYDTIVNTTGRLPLWFRPPYGAFRKDLAHIPAELGMGIAYWSVDPQDWARPGASVITQRVLQQTVPGSVILMHDLHHQTAEAVDDVLSGLRARAFAFNNMTRLMGQPYA